MGLRYLFHDYSLALVCLAPVKVHVDDDDGDNNNNDDDVIALSPL